ncbi:ABC transporter permease [Candidatus Cloacimonadota bacterium]
MLKNFITVAFRNIGRHKVFTLINLIGLVLGITAFMLIMIWVGYEMSYDKFNENKDRIQRLCVDFEAGSHMVYPMTMPAAGPLLNSEFPEIENAARLEAPTRANIKIGEKSFVETGVCHADNSVFDVFTFPFVDGDPNTALIDPFAVVISESMAQKYFKSKDPIGQALDINGRGSFTITGVFKDIPQNSHFSFNIVASFETLYTEDKDMMENWFHIQFFTYLLFAKNADIGSFEAKLPAFIDKHLGETLDSFGASLELFLQPLTSIHLYSELAGDLAIQSDIKLLYLFIAIALFVLLIACINFINLSTANSTARAKEIGMRKAIGSGRWQLIMQFMIESIILCFLAMLVAMSLVEIIRPYLFDVFGTYVDLTFISPTRITFLLLAFPVCIGILAGSYPAFYLSRLKPIKILKSGLYKSAHKSLFRSILVIFQFSISIILIVSTLTIFKQINFMKETNPGFAEENVIIIPGVRQLAKSSSHDVLKQALEKIAEVEIAGFSSLFPGRGIQKAVMYPEGFSADQPQMGEKLFVDAGFLEALGIEMAEGRYFSEEMSTDPEKSVIINQTAARKFGWDKSIGKTFTIPSRDGESYKMEVVGVVEDFHSASLHTTIEPLIIYNDVSRANFIVIKAAGGNISGTIDSIKKQIKQLVPDHLLKYYFLDETLDNMYRRDQRTAGLALYFSALAILLGCLGLLGLTTFLVQNRNKEIGIRKVLGSSVSGIVILLTKEFCKWVLIAVLIAWPVSYFIMNKWLQGFAYRSNIGAAVFLISAGFSLLIAIITVSSQTIKAARANPVKTLKYE